MSSPRHRILLGHIGQAQGIRGEVVVHAHTAMPEDIAAYGPLSDAGGTRTIALTVLRTSKKGVVCRIAGVTDRTAAEALRGTELYVDRDRLPAPTDEEFYHADLIGLAAVDGAGQPIGRVVAMQNFGAGDLVEIELAGTRRTELVPFSKQCVPRIDLAQRRLVVVMPEDQADDDDDDGPAG